MEVQSLNDLAVDGTLNTSKPATTIRFWNACSFGALLKKVSWWFGNSCGWMDSVIDLHTTGPDSRLDAYGTLFLLTEYHHNSIIKSWRGRVSCLVSTACHSYVAVHWSKYHCYKQALSRYDLRCLKATFNPNKQSNSWWWPLYCLLTVCRILP